MKLEDLPEDLKETDALCKLWARVTRDTRTRREESALYRAMRLYGGYIPPRDADDGQTKLALTAEEQRAGWQVERVWRRLILPHKNILLLWYIYNPRSPGEAARILRTSVRQMHRRLLAALYAVKANTTT